MQTALNNNIYSLYEKENSYNLIVLKIVSFFTTLSQKISKKSEERKAQKIAAQKIISEKNISNQENKVNFIWRYLFNIAITHTIRRAVFFEKINTDLKVILEDLKTDPAKFELNSLNEDTKKLISILIKEKELYDEVDYLCNDNLKTEVSKALRNLFTIEVKTKSLLIQNTKSQRKSDPLFQAISNKPKHFTAESN